jgi:hypothetical protein
MNTTTQTGQITLPAAELRSILAALDTYTTGDKTRHALTLARVTPIIVEQTTNDETRPTALVWEATNSTELISITHRTAHTLTEPALIDPAALLATMPKKSETKHIPSVLTLTGEKWQLRHDAARTSTGTITPAQWPNTFGLWKDQQAALAPHSIGADMLNRLAKLAKHLDADYATAASMAHTDGKPDPRRPLTYTITAGHIETRILIMPRRPN